MEPRSFTDHGYVDSLLYEKACKYLKTKGGKDSPELYAVSAPAALHAKEWYEWECGLATVDIAFNEFVDAVEDFGKENGLDFTNTRLCDVFKEYSGQIYEVVNRRGCRPPGLAFIHAIPKQKHSQKIWVIRDKKSKKIYEGYGGHTPKLYVKKSHAQTALKHITHANKSNYEIVAMTLKE